MAPSDRYPPHNSLHSTTVLAVLVAAVAAMLLSIIAFEGLWANRQAVESERKLIDRAIHFARARILEEQRSIAQREDTVRHTTAQTWDDRFVDDQVGHFMLGTYGHDEVYILNSDGVALSAYFDGRPQSATDLAERRPTLQPFIDDIWRGLAGSDRCTPTVRPEPGAASTAPSQPVTRSEACLFILDGRPAIVAVTPIASDPETVEPNGMLSIAWIDETFITIVGRALGLRDLQAIGAVPPHDRALASVTITPHFGDGRTYITWSPARPGDVMLHIVAPLTLMVTLLAAIAISLLLRRMRQAHVELLEGKALAERLSAEAQRAEQLKSEFLTNMSHEVRTPLNGVTGCASLLQMEGLTPTQRSLADTIVTSAQSLLALLEDVLELARIDAGFTQVIQAPFDPAEIAREATNAVACVALQKGLRLQVRLSAGAERRCLGDSRRVKQALINLLGNAVKFTDAGGVCLHVSRPRADRVRFELEDTGIGIPRDQHQAIFERFVQVDASMTRRHGGTGLGLAITKDLIHSMGGAIGVVSEPGHGSLFWVELPAALAPEQPARMRDPDQPQITDIVRPPADHTGGTTPIRVLYVEDNPRNQRVIGAMLSALNMDVECVFDGSQGVQAWREKHFDIILMDLYTPNVDGFEAARRIRALEKEYGRPPSPIIAISARAENEVRQACFDAGMNAFCQKPVKLDDLSHAIHALRGAGEPSGDETTPPAGEDALANGVAIGQAGGAR